MSSVTVKDYDMAENERGEMMIAIPDQGFAVDDGAAVLYRIAGDRMVLTFPDKRELILEEVPQSAQPQLLAGKEILVVETTETELTRSYYLQPGEILPKKPNRRVRF